MKTTLGQIANIQTGVFAKPEAQGEIVYLQSKHFDQNGQLSSKLHLDLPKANISEKHLLKHEDVLFAAKGTKNFAAMFENTNLPAVASTSFFVIRVNGNSRNVVLPEFLVWFINQHNTQKKLKANAIGTSMVSISKAFLLDLEINVPSLLIQEKILKIANLQREERRLKNELDIRKEIFIQNLLINTTLK